MTFYLHSLSVTSLTALLSYWLPSLLVISSCAWILSDAAVRSTKEEWPQLFEPLTTPLMIMMPEVQPRGKRTVYIATMMILILLAGMGLGYGSREHQLATNTWTYTDVTVMNKATDREFIIWPDLMKQQHVTLCSASTGWYAGEVLSDFTFEQRQGCKRVISYHEKQKGELDAALPIGR